MDIYLWLMAEPDNHLGVHAFSASKLFRSLSRLSVYGDSHYGKTRMGLYDRMRLLQLALDALTLRLNEAKHKQEDESEQKAKRKIW